MNSREMLTEDEVMQLLADGAFGADAYIHSIDENGIFIRDDTLGIGMTFQTIAIPRAGSRRRKYQRKKMPR